MKNEINCSFMTMASTGERPVAEIHIAGFKRDGGLQSCGHIEGGGQHTVMLIANMVESHAEALAKRDTLEAAAFITMIGMAAMRGAGEKAAKMANKLVSPEGIVDLLKRALEEDE